MDVDAMHALVDSLSEEELAQAVMAGMFTPKQTRTFNLPLPSSLSTASSPEPLSFSAPSEAHAKNQRRLRNMSAPARARAFTAVRIASPGFDAMDQADEWTRSLLKQHGFVTAYLPSEDDFRDGDARGDDDRSASHGTHNMDTSDSANDPSNSSSPSQSRRNRDPSAARHAAVQTSQGGRSSLGDVGGHVSRIPVM
ncbi:hypothetical protein PTSG_03675 [Salpingoeca rosetta]|uniref:Uncharacterized protein n=1 Tax=Salpingoeca rosetta (strain ATCC 50818 / BSB-021) TaxID=946362 RepID=F2U696_SALR5|nr:uncharacterized protein PTSG_03675 [Salpingoeca rosetta]EGD83037.1 hypothetical protein PTSG_03675 [Salpingoeca rosetta]|eukprot:XP_004995401.1 hypothetical protein PTSG_03675 [Salpingoeca rosetta]